jgi:DNA-binding transcriptional ArsR family regulator
MKTEEALEAFMALSQTTRLDVFRLLVRHEPDGLPAGEIARRLDVPHNTMSVHLRVLNHAGLVASERHSRSIVYRARLPRLRDLVLFLVKDCCNGDPALCGPLAADLATCIPEEPRP